MKKKISKIRIVGYSKYFYARDWKDVESDKERKRKKKLKKRRRKEVRVTFVSKNCVGSRWKRGIEKER